MSTIIRFDRNNLKLSFQKTWKYIFKKNHQIKDLYINWLI